LNLLRREDGLAIWLSPTLRERGWGRALCRFPRDPISVARKIFFVGNFLRLLLTAIERNSQSNRFGPRRVQIHWTPQCPAIPKALWRSFEHCPGARIHVTQYAFLPTHFRMLLQMVGGLARFWQLPRK
jgi:hypothetical protein